MNRTCHPNILPKLITNRVRKPIRIDLWRRRWQGPRTLPQISHHMLPQNRPRTRRLLLLRIRIVLRALRMRRLVVGLRIFRRIGGSSEQLSIIEPGRLWCRALPLRFFRLRIFEDGRAERFRSWWTMLEDRLLFQSWDDGTGEAGLLFAIAGECLTFVHNGHVGDPRVRSGTYSDFVQCLGGQFRGDVATAVDH